MNLPMSSEKFVCLDPRRLDTYGKVIHNIHIEVWSTDAGIGFFCYGDLIRDYSRICFGYSNTLEGAVEAINNLSPYEGTVDELYFNLDE